MIGTTLSHYRILEELGAGGMGEVYAAEDSRLGRRVALKILPREVAADPERLARFEREARAVAALNHPNIVTIHSVEQAGPVRFLTMELVKGSTLDGRIPPGGLAADRLLELAVPLADAVAAAHDKGVTHRDLKPGNVMVTPEGRLKVLDFGLAKLRDDAPEAAAAELPTRTLTEEGRLVGTLPYMSPEQLQGRAADHRSDIFSLGILFYEMAAGRRPFAGETGADLASSILRDEPPPLTGAKPHLPRHLDRIVRRCLEKDPRRRFQSALDLRNDLAGLQREIAAGEERADLSIAVLAFADMSPDKDQDYFCEGMAEEIINNLTKLRGLRVASRTSSFQFKGAADIRAIGERLGVGHVLEGSVRKAGNRLRVTAQLIEVAGGYHLWSDRYDREIEDVFAIQDEIAESVAQALRGILSPAERREIHKAPTRNVEAYDDYLKGRKFFYRTGRANFEVAKQMFRRAIDVDPAFALAYAGIADCGSFLYHMWSDPAGLEEALEASARALELDPELAEAHAARGLALSGAERYAEAEEELRTALRLNPRLFEAHYFFGRSCFAQGKLQEAARHFQRAAEVRPDDYQTPALLATVYRGLGREEDARRTSRRALELAAAHLELNPDDARALYLGAGALVELGERERGLEWARRASAIGPQEPAVLYNLACVYSLAGAAEEALDCLERAVRAGSAQRVWLEHDADLDPLRDHPRFRALVNELT